MPVVMNKCFLINPEKNLALIHLSFSRISRKTTRRICAIFYSEFRRKHLFITTCIEKSCTLPLKLKFKTSRQPASP